MWGKCVEKLEKFVVESENIGIVAMLSHLLIVMDYPANDTS